ncbi:MAG: response regulator transcription factor [Planctomycetaceae bacterium]|nr:response regulator transcription factor [Planctomycetaceae bacterium]
MSVKLVIADDHEVVRAGLQTLLRQSEFEIVAEATTGDQAVAVTQEHRPDLVILDVRMPGGDGLQALAQIRQQRPDLPVIMLSTFDNPTYVARALALGASGYLLKEISREALLESLRKVAGGESIWSREELRRVTGALATPRNGEDGDVSLTRRESEVLRQMALGLTNKEIAQSLHISYETVKEHVQHILRKVGVADRTQAAVWAVRRGLV